MKKIPDLFLMTVLITAICFFSFNTARKEQPRQLINKSAIIPDSLIHSGQLIFRDGRGIISGVFKKLSLRDHKYSHAGIIHLENGKAYVYHMLGGEGGKNNYMRKELLQSFCSPQESNSFAVYQADVNNLLIDSIATAYFKRKITFDEAFDLSSDDKMYCTELIWKILQTISGKDKFLSLTELSGVKYISCDDIYMSGHCKIIFSQLMKNKM
jgi:hypothetical protein